jgi:hypothetical protein
LADAIRSFAAFTNSCPVAGLAIFMPIKLKSGKSGG